MLSHSRCEQDLAQNAATTSAPLAPLLVPSRVRAEGDYDNICANPCEEALVAVRRAIDVVDSLATLCTPTPCVGEEVRNSRVTEKVAYMQIILSAAISVAESQWIDLEGAVYRRVRTLGLHGKLKPCTARESPEQLSATNGSATTNRRNMRGITWDNDGTMVKQPTGPDEGVCDASSKRCPAADGRKTDREVVGDDDRNSNGVVDRQPPSRGAENVTLKFSGKDCVNLRGERDILERVNITGPGDPIEGAGTPKKVNVAATLPAAGPCKVAQPKEGKEQREPTNLGVKKNVNDNVPLLHSEVENKAPNEKEGRCDRANENNGVESGNDNRAEDKSHSTAMAVGTVQCWWNNPSCQLPQGELGSPRSKTEGLQAPLTTSSGLEAAEDAAEGPSHGEDCAVSVAGTGICSKGGRNLHEMVKGAQSQFSVSASVTPVTPVLCKGVFCSSAAQPASVSENGVESNILAALVDVVEVTASKSPVVPLLKGEASLDTLTSSKTATATTTLQRAGTVGADCVDLMLNNLRDRCTSAAPRTSCLFGGGVGTIVTCGEIEMCGGPTHATATGTTAVSKQSGEGVDSLIWDARTIRPKSANGLLDDVEYEKSPGNDIADLDNNGHRHLLQPRASSTASQVGTPPSRSSVRGGPFDGPLERSTSQAKVTPQLPPHEKPSHCHDFVQSANVTDARQSEPAVAVVCLVPSDKSQTEGAGCQALGRFGVLNSESSTGETRLIPYGLLLLQQVLRERSTSGHCGRCLLDPTPSTNVVA